MFAAIASAFLAAAVPSDKMTSVAVAEYWQKKDDRGRGDDISEQAKPRRYAAFALSDDTFVLRDPFVRRRHLDRIELSFRGDRVPATEVARIESPDAVVLKAGRRLKGIVPLRFGKGEAKEKVVWRWSNDMLVASASGVGTNDTTTVVSSTGRIFRSGPSDALYLDKDRNPVWLDFGARFEIPNGKFEYVPPAEWTRLPADSFEKSAAAMEARASAASLSLLIRLEPEDRDDGRRRSRYDDDAKNEMDALGFAVEGRIVVPSDLKGDRIARLSKVEATFPDGSVTNLVFGGALAEWDAMVFDVPEPFKAKLKFLEVAKCAAEDLDNRVAWPAKVENENGRVVATAARCRFNGVEFVRGAKFVPRVEKGPRDDWRTRDLSFVLDEDGRIAEIVLARRFGESRWSHDIEAVPAADLASFVAGEGMNPEFAPRKADERNRLVWLGVETVRLTDALARERKAQSFLGEYSRPPYVTEVYAGSPAEKSGIKTGDVLLAVRRGSEAERSLEAESDYYSSRDWGAFFASGSSYTPSSTPWPDVENSINTLMTAFGAGAKVTLVYARDGKRREATVWLEAAPVHYKNAVKARNRALGLSVKDMTFEVRRYFKFDDSAPGVVIAKVKPGSPAAVAGLMPFELVTEVNGEKVSGAKDFASKIKGKKDLVFAVRRLAQTRMVKIHVEPEKDKEKKQ